MFTRAGVAVAIALLLARPAAAVAGESLGLMVSGDCRDPDLLQGARLLAKELRAQLGSALVAEDALRERIAPVAQADAEDLSRQIDVAQTLFYNGEYSRAAVAIERTIVDIRRFPPERGRWALQLRAELLAGQVLRRAGRPESDDAFRRVLRLKPTHRLDPDYFMPTIRARFEKLRGELAAQPKRRLEVKSSPSGAEVYLDGAKMGATPAALEVIAGDYEVVVVKDGLRSLPRTVAVEGDTSTMIDLQFEGAIQLDRDPCLAAAPGDDKTRLAGAMKVATLVGVDLMVLLQLARGAAGPAQFGASVLDVQTGQKIRYGEIQLHANPDRPTPAIAELARFVVTGEQGRQLRAVRVVQGRAGPSRPSDAPHRPRTLAELAPAYFPASPPSIAARPFPWPTGWRGKAILGLGGGGAAALIAGAVLLVVGNNTMEASNAYFAAGPPDVAALAQVGPLREAARMQQAAAVVGLVAGGLAMTAAGALWLGEH